MTGAGGNPRLIVLPAEAAAIDGAGAPMGLVVVALVLASFALAMRISGPGEARLDAGRRSHAQGR